MWDALLDCVFPRRSLGNEDGAWITASEKSLLLRSAAVQENAAALRREGAQHLDALFAAFHYRSAPLLRTAVWRFKYRRIRSIGSEMGEMLAHRIPAEFLQGAVLCPVPLHWLRRYERGFNQAEILAQSIAAHHAAPVQEMLRRCRSTGHQAHRDRAHRRATMRSHVFRACSPVPPHVILVDDVATTCATLDACAFVLKQAGALRVEACVLARG